ncbi:hypothetical protein B0I35DRAFT_472265 [Stachybotrys elegans]|uniref:DUF7703 domain-containing protein n=1 Tax=Stachybotrys elegans TaxID=80388 RepID=A0A8K0WIU6_9HYPO|nr:hypothetical protein B0I35DRAFT_472265 [Stachybotrys elegans]
MAGETGPLSDPLPINMTIAGFFAIACYNCIEILVMLIDRFKRHNGLYFWAILVTTLGILCHSTAVLLRYYALGPNFTLAVLTCVGWYGMVTGFSVVLYSRLNLVVPDEAKTRWVLIMIISSFCVFHIPVTILFLGSNTKHTRKFIQAFHVYESVQLAGFTIQESLISTFYIVETIRTLKPILVIKMPKERKIIKYLITINVFAILLDISLLVTQYTGNFQIQTTYKPVVYSIKLKMEFAILNRLLRLVQNNGYNECTALNEASSGVISGSISPAPRSLFSTTSPAPSMAASRMTTFSAAPRALSP